MPALQRRAAAYVRAAYAREAVLKKVDFETYNRVCMSSNSTHFHDLCRARAALHPAHGHYLPLDAPAEQQSNLEIARNTATGAVIECNNILMEEEKRAMSPQVLSIIAGNKSASCVETAYSWWTAPLAPHSARWSADAWRAAMSATLGYCPPGLEPLATADDPIMRKSLSHKSYGTSIKRHNNVVREEHSIERQAHWVSATEVSNLYPDGRRPDTAGITPQGVFRMTDVKVTDPHTAARLANGATVQSVIISAENEKHRKYNSGDCLLGQDVKLTPLVFTPGGRIGPAAEDHFRDLSQEIASIRAPFKPEEQRAALANSIYRGIRTRMAVAVQRGIAVQILTFGLERRFGASLQNILKHFPVAARPNTHVLPIRPLGVT